MKQGDVIWVRDISNMSEKTKCIFQFEKDYQIVVSFDDHRYMAIFDKSCIVDPPSENEAEIDECNNVLCELYETANSSPYTRKLGFYEILESMGYKLVKQECRNG